jgi:hypothetical protein
MKKTILFTFFGSLAGYGYYYFVGCNGTCSITSSSINSIAYGAIVGLVMGFPARAKSKDETQ